jgi:hypothetical protein
MLAEGDRPQVGPAGLSLGVRVPPDENADIPVDADGMVEAGTGGMSVGPTWRLLPVHRIPRRFRTKFPRAAGKNGIVLWRMGDGPFTEGPFAEGLRFRPDPEKPTKHGFVEPSARVPIDEYQAALAAPRDRWVID